MKTLLAKEIRLMSPVYGAALLLAVVPVWLLPGEPAQIMSAEVYRDLAIYPFCFGAVLLALASFGREFGLNTFPSLLAQPLERADIWRSKIAVLAAAMATIFGAWCLSCLARWPGGLPHTGPGMPAIQVTLATGGIATLAAFSGGLWTTLLFRQVTASFWFTILLPATIAMIISVFGGGNTFIFGALALYAITGFFLARTLFFHAEETGWTGGTIVLSGWKSAGVVAGAKTRYYGPWAAMIRKEFQLHQIGLAGIVALFAVHMGTLAFHNSRVDTLAAMARTVSELCCMVWCVAPLIIGATSVAEERKLGTMEAHLCLPVSSRRQFAIKLFFVILLGGVLSPALFWIRIHIGHGMTGIADYGEMTIFATRDGRFGLSLLFAGIALLAFYASTLTRNIMQALAAGVITVVSVIAFNIAAGFNLDAALRLWPWRGWLVYLIGLPTLVLVFIWLSYRNFRRITETWRLWRRNLLGLAGALLFIGTATAAIYNRAWEWFTPLEPAHGPARLADDQFPSLRAEYYRYGSLTLKLPDGRVWENRLFYHSGRSFELSGQPLALPVGGKWNSFAGDHFVAGSNWVDAVALLRDTVAIRSDGTLWVSETSRPGFLYDGKRNLLPDRSDPLTQYGDETDWKSVVSPNGSTDVLLLKTDGTLWLWEAWDFDWHKTWPGLRAFKPYRLGTASDWADIAVFQGDYGWGNSWLYAWKTNGQAWGLTGPFNFTVTRQRPRGGLEPGKGLERQESFDNTKWRSLTEWSPQWQRFRAGVRENGTLWVWGVEPAQENLGSRLEYTRRIEQVGQDTNWVAVAGDQNSLVALKADGTLWRWHANPNRWLNKSVWPVAKPPVQVGSNHDWMAVCGTMRGVVCLAADGSLWFWWGRDVEHFSEAGEPLLAASRKPVKLGNIFGQE